MKILWIMASPRVESHSTKLAEALIEKIESQIEKSIVTVENISKSSPSHLTDLTLESFFTPEERLSDDQREHLSQSDYYINQLMTNDFIVISYPVWNFSVPSSIKAWIDQIVRVGKTFKYIDGKPLGLIEKKKVFLVSARGGVYPEKPSDNVSLPFDYSSLMMKTILTYIGMNDITEIQVSGLAIPGLKESAFEKALADLEDLTF